MFVLTFVFWRFMFWTFIFIIAFKYNQDTQGAPPNSIPYGPWLLPERVRPLLRNLVELGRLVGAVLAIVLDFYRTGFHDLLRWVGATKPVGTLARGWWYCFLVLKMYLLPSDKNDPADDAAAGDSTQFGVDVFQLPTDIVRQQRSATSRFEDLRQSMAKLKTASERLTEETAWLDGRVRAVVTCTNILGAGIDHLMKEVDWIVDERSVRRIS
ncbi:unnamed protein product [Zymoseptoria tritici ST99CH_1A5]|uniref:Uncharacterized protein n=2 Tax=Zymoseptoria tritici TaxID=1047171 RepID=A0A2H1GC33_ZYMTR|nr:unnamed protein product [Zymoseptoria tritici ST99CH_1E4]SMY23798.1 unnamed protein product [Zymoseptoria tritici ST99CH_1A5]